MTKDVHPAVADLSYSRLDSWESCPAAFWHGYVNRTAPDGYERVEAWTGTLVHQVLEEALRETLAKRVPDPVAVLQRYEDLWDAGVGEHVISVRDDRTVQEYRAKGRQWIQDYLDDAWPFVRDGEPLHVEEQITYPVTLADGAEVAFKGVLDRVDRLGDGRLRLMDYKTGSWVPDFTAHRDAFQLALYWHGLARRYPDAPGGVLTWHYLQRRRSKHVDPDPALLDASQRWLRDTAGKIHATLQRDPETKRAFPARPGPLCRWCQFGYACDENPHQATAPRPRA